MEVLTTGIEVIEKNEVPTLHYFKLVLKIGSTFSGERKGEPATTLLENLDVFA